MVVPYRSLLQKWLKVSLSGADQDMGYCQLNGSSWECECLDAGMVGAKPFSSILVGWMDRTFTFASDVAGA